MSCLLGFISSGNANLATGVQACRQDSAAGGPKTRKRGQKPKGGATL